MTFSRLWPGPWLVAAVVLAGLTLRVSEGPAQVATAITSSGSLGTTVTAPAPGGTVFQITGGSRAGSNLFHSFGLFSIGASDTARFNNTTPVVPTANIVSRVTGGQVSQIFGTIDTLSYPGANLFLVNPAGMVFGPSATLNVAGSVRVSTADDYVRFADGAKFFIDPSKSSVLSAAEPAAFGFLSSTPAPIAIQGSTLTVPSGQTLAVVGGDLKIQIGEDGRSPRLSAPSGRVELVSAASRGEVVFNGSVDVSSLTRLGRIDLSDGATVDAGGDPGGTVLIRAGRLVATGSIITADTLGPTSGAPLAVDVNVVGDAAFSGGSAIIVLTHGSGDAGDIRVVAGRLELQQSAIVSFSLASGRGADVSLDVGTLSLTDGSRVNLSSVPALGPGGPAGDLRVTARDSILISGPGSGINNGTNSEVPAGTGGDIVISGGTLTVTNFADITSRSVGVAAAGDIIMNVGSFNLTGGATIGSGGAEGSGGKVTLVADSALISGAPGGIFSGSSGAGSTGLISLNVGTLTLTAGARIQSGSEIDPAGGNIAISARDSVVISNGGTISSQAFSADIGTLTISAPLLQMAGGLIEASTIGDARAGDIFVKVGTLDLTGGAQIVASSALNATGAGGNLSIAATNEVSLAGRSLSAPVSGFSNELSSGLFSTAASSGVAGSIAVVTPTLKMVDGAKISTNSAEAGGGNISITSTGSFVYLLDSEISTSVHGGLGQGGNITIGTPVHPMDFVVLNNSQILANAFGGPGGNITVFTDGFLTQNSVLDASSALSTPGIINIQAQTTNVTGALTQLPANVLQAATLLRASCAARLAQGKASTLVVAGREGVPPEPEGLLWSPLAEGPATRGLSWSDGHDWETFPRFARVSLLSKCER